MDKMIVSMLLSILLVSTALAGCTGGDDDDDTTDDTTDTVVEKIMGCTDATALNYNASADTDDSSCTYATPIKVWHTYAIDTTEEDAMNNVVAAFEAAHPEIDLTVEYKPFDDAKSAFITAAQAGEAPDVVRIQNDALGEVAANSVGGVSILEDLAPYMTAAESSAYGSSLSGVTVSGKVLGLPQSGDSLALYYNKDVLDAAGVDYTNISAWGTTEFIGAANAVADPMNDTWGVCFPYKSAYQFWPWMTGYGGSIFDSNGNPTINSVATVTAIQTIGTLLAGHPDGAYGPLMKVGCDWGNMEDMFKANKVAFMIQGPWAYGGINDANVNFGFSTLPDSPVAIPFSPFVGMKGWSVSSGSANKEAAVTVAKYFAGYDSQVEFAKTAKLLPTMPSVLEHPDVANDSVVAGFGAQMAKGFGAPAYAAMGQVWGPTDSMLADVFDRGMDPAAAAIKAQAAIEKALGLNYTVDADGDDDNYGTHEGDCDDTNASINPGITTDTAGDGVDTNCDGVDGIAADLTLVVHTMGGHDQIHMKGGFDDSWGINHAATLGDDNETWTITIQRPAGTYEWGAIFGAGGSWLLDEAGAKCGDSTGADPNYTSGNCVVTLGEDGTITGQNYIHVMMGM